MTPLPMFASTFPVLRSNLKTGSTGLFSQSTGPPPAVPAPQRSYPQTCPSFGSISRPADVPHVRPAGSSPQFLVTFGAGFGNPSPVIGFGTFDCALVVNANAAHAPTIENRTRDVVIASPIAVGPAVLRWPPASCP